MGSSQSPFVVPPWGPQAASPSVPAPCRYMALERILIAPREGDEWLTSDLPLTSKGTGSCRCCCTVHPVCLAPGITVDT